MPKRKNPFGDTAPIQLKTHVSSKQVASKQDMEEVYKRTREKLFHTVLSKNEDACESNTLLKALVCRCCNKPIKVSRFTCSSCQISLCSRACLQECCTCGQEFCQFCTVLNYDQAQVRAFCFNCLSSFQS